MTREMSKFLVFLWSAGTRYQGASFVDVVSPCVAFNNHPGSTKSYDFVREHNEAVNRLDFMPVRPEIKADYAEGPPGLVRALVQNR